jgi:hypothetical protein
MTMPKEYKYLRKEEKGIQSEIKPRVSTSSPLVIPANRVRPQKLKKILVNNPEKLRIPLSGVTNLKLPNNAF